MIRRIWPFAAFCVLALLVSLGIAQLLSQAQKNVLLIRLPEVPPLYGKSEVLKQKINEANDKVRVELAQRGLGVEFGKMVGELGRLYQGNHFYDDALSCYRLAQEYDKRDARWFYLSASIHQQKGENESMIGLLNHTLALSSGYSPAVLKLADTYFKAGKMEEARGYYERRLKLEPEDPYALMGLARIALDLERWEEAEAYLQKAIAADQEFGDAHRLMGAVHEHYGRREEMKKSLDRAAACNRFRPAPDPWIRDLQDLCYEPDQLLVLGAMALADLDIETAINKHFARALEIDPQNPEAYLATGKAWFMAGQWSRAYKYLARTIELDPKSDQAYFHLGLILRAQNRLPDAEEMLLRALEIQSNNVNVLNNLGVVMLEQGRYVEAIEYFTKALEIYPEHLNARYNLGMSLWASGKSKDAVSQYSQVLEMKPTWSVAANSLAWLLATDGDETVRDGESAVRWALVAIQGENERNPELLDTLAAAYAEAGQYEKAVRIARQAMNLAREGGNMDLAGNIEGRMRLYESGKPFHRASAEGA